MKGYFEDRVDHALHDYHKIGDEQLRRQVRLVMKEIARDVRHRAVEITQAAATKIIDIDMDA